MAKPIYPQDPFRETYYYPVVLREDMENAFKLSQNDNIPISIIGLQTTSPHVSGTGYIDSSGNSTHANIHTFLSINGIANPPPSRFGFNYLSSFAFSSYTEHIPVSSISSIANATPQFYYLSANGLTGTYDINTILLSGIFGKHIKIYEVSGEDQPSKVDGINFEDFPYNCTVYYPTIQCLSNLYLIGDYEIINNTISKKIIYDFKLRYEVNNSKFYEQFYFSRGLSGADYYDSSGNFVSSTREEEPKQFFDKGIFYCNDVSSENGVKIPRGNKEIGLVNFYNSFKNVKMNYQSSVVTPNSARPASAIDTQLICNAIVKGECDLANNYANLSTNVYFNGAVNKYSASGNLEVVDSVSSVKLPTIKLTDKGSSIQKEFSKLMIQFYAESSKNPSLKLIDFINVELAKKSDLHRAIIIDITNNCKGLECK